MELPTAGDAPLTRFERAGLGLLLLAVVGFGGLVLVRSAFQQDRKTDLGVYLRAAYAVRTGVGIYDAVTCDDNGWHYCYPPPFAIVMAPLADPYRWADRAGYLPYWLSVVVWYALSVWLAWAAADRFARTVLSDARPGSRRWWYARLVPLYVCVGGVGFTLARGQVNILVVWLTAGMFAAAVVGRPVRAGCWLAAAVALKVIPGYLGLFLVADRPGRAVRGVLGLVLGLALWLVAVPAAVWGWDKTIASNRTFVDAVLAPGALGTGDHTGRGS
ncbi:MAG: glycosyltransferase family 87 protein [Gemmataceae bacterium]